MFSPKSILDMPDLVMRKILEDVDLISTLNLRKVCRAFQNFINNTHQIDLNVNSVSIKLRGDAVFMLLKVVPGEEIDMTIQKSSLGCTVFIEYEYGEQEIYEMNDVTVLEELKICLEGIIESQKTLLPFFNLDCIPMYVRPQQSKFLSFFGCCERQTTSSYLVADYEPSEKALNETLEWMDQVRKTLKRPMQVRKFSISIFEPSQLRKLLSNLDVESLRHLAINTRKRERRDFEKIDLDEILEYFPMVNVEKLHVEDSLVTSSIRSIMHIPDFEIMVKDISVEELLQLRKIFLTSLGPRRALMFLNNRQLSDRLISALSSSSYEVNPSEFYYGIPKQNRCVHISLSCCCLYLLAMERKEVPEYYQVFDLPE